MSLAIIVDYVDSNSRSLLSGQQLKVTHKNHHSRIRIEACIQQIAAVDDRKHIAHMQHGIQSGRLINRWTTGL
jgi:hypothetical protein